MIILELVEGKVCGKGGKAPSHSLLEIFLSINPLIMLFKTCSNCCFVDQVNKGQQGCLRFQCPHDFLGSTWNSYCLWFPSFHFPTLWLSNHAMLTMQSTRLRQDLHQCLTLHLCRWSRGCAFVRSATSGRAERTSGSVGEGAGRWGHGQGNMWPCPKNGVPWKPIALSPFPMKIAIFVGYTLHFWLHSVG